VLIGVGTVVGSCPAQARLGLTVAKWTQPLGDSSNKQQANNLTSTRVLSKVVQLELPVQVQPTALCDLTSPVCFSSHSFNVSRCLQVGLFVTCLEFDFLSLTIVACPTQGFPLNCFWCSPNSPNLAPWSLVLSILSFSCSVWVLNWYPQCHSVILQTWYSDIYHIQITQLLFVACVGSFCVDCDPAWK
jgi:hypothetical protein